MDNRRTMFWLAFLGAAGALALIPEFFEAPTGEVVQVAVPAPAPAPHRGQLAELRSPAVPQSAAGAAAPRPVESGPGVRPEAVAGRAGAPSAPVADLFAAHSWQAPPPPPPPAAPPPPPAAPLAPSAPPLPFQYLGKLDDSQRLLVFLVRGERIFTVGEGDVIENAYKVKAITDTQMTFVYLPLNLDQTLAVGSKL